MPRPLCNLYVDLKFVPGQSFIETKREIEAVIADLKADDADLRAEVHFYLVGNGYELERDSAVVVAIKRAHRAVYGSRSPTRHPAATQFPVMPGRWSSMASMD